MKKILKEVKSKDNSKLYSLKREQDLVIEIRDLKTNELVEKIGIRKEYEICFENLKADIDFILEEYEYTDTFFTLYKKGE